MPIAFPPYSLDSSITNFQKLVNKTFYVVPAPNMCAPNRPFSQYCLDPGKAQKGLMANTKELGKPYRDPARTSVVNPAVGIDEGVDHNQAVPFTRVLGSLNTTLSGVSRDATGATLANCQVLIFRTEDKSLVGETTSDASGNWSILIMKGGPFFFVEYKAGSPDVFGTSKNTLTVT
jgi:hypothetical protein